MEPRELLRLLMARNKENANKLAVKLSDKGVTQPQLHKFLTGATAEPRRSTMRPLADYYGVAVDAFYDEHTAASEAKRLGLIEGEGLAPAPAPAPPGPAYDAITEDEHTLLDDFRVLPDEDQSELRTDIHQRATKARAHIQKVLGVMGAEVPSVRQISDAFVHYRTYGQMSLSDNSYVEGSTTASSSPAVAKPPDEVPLKRSVMDRADARLKGGDNEDSQHRGETPRSGNG